MDDSVGHVVARAASGGGGSTCGPPSPPVAQRGWGDRVHSWAFAGPLPDTQVATIATLPLVRPLAEPLSLELRLAATRQAGANQPTTWRYALADDAAGVPFWSLVTLAE